MWEAFFYVKKQNKTNNESNKQSVACTVFSFCYFKTCLLILLCWGKIHKELLVEERRRNWEEDGNRKERLAGMVGEREKWETRDWYRKGIDFKRLNRDFILFLRFWFLNKYLYYWLEVRFELWKKLIIVKTISGWEDGKNNYVLFCLFQIIFLVP